MAKTEQSARVPQWTEARYWQFLRSLLRSGWNKYPVKHDLLRGVRKSVEGQRHKFEYPCISCDGWFKAEDVQVDHITPAGSLSCYEDAVSFLDNLFCGVDNLRVLCKPCHLKVTAKQANEAKETRSVRALYPREESTHRNMISRCHNPKATGYEYYGGAGITVCDSWRESFYNFYKDMGVRPDGMSLDRVDVYKGYNKENCRWATPIEQARNTTANNLLCYNDEVHCIADWADKVGVKQNTLLYRLKRGWSTGEALGFKERAKKEYSGRLSISDIEDLIDSVDNGATQTDVGKRLGIDSSQVSRIYNRFKHTKLTEGESNE